MSDQERIDGVLSGAGRKVRQAARDSRLAEEAWVDWLGQSVPGGYTVGSVKIPTEGAFRAGFLAGLRAGRGGQ